MLLAGDGHDVTVFERDPAPPPDPSEGWDAWERRGVNQFRQPHFLATAFREMADAELPGLVDDLEAAGAYRFDMLAEFTGGHLHDSTYDTVTARRPVLESVVARRAERTPGVTVRRGVGVAGLVSAPERGGTPHVKGVVTEAGEKIGADLTVAAGGRRAVLGEWLTAIDARPILHEQEDSGFVYYGRHIRSRDGSMITRVPSYVHYGAISLLLLPGDDGTAGVGIIGWSGDHEIRDLRRQSAWDAVVAQLPEGEAILDAEAISPQSYMGALEDRWCRLSPDGEPVATGVVAVSDAFSATNPSLGRGISLGFRSSIALRDSLREAGEHPRRICEAYDRRQQESLTPWYRATVWNDRHRLEQCRAIIENRTAQLDSTWLDDVRIGLLPGKDLSFLPRVLDYRSRLRELPHEIAADPEVQGLLEGFAPDPPPEVLSRPRLLELIGANR
jgi:2-polyprenyl-6-methoxyphenol hydroxylase-like FAD-dependent oxidoreductase